MEVNFLSLYSLVRSQPYNKPRIGVFDFKTVVSDYMAKRLIECETNADALNKMTSPHPHPPPLRGRDGWGLDCRFLTILEEVFHPFDGAEFSTHGADILFTRFPLFVVTPRLTHLIQVFLPQMTLDRSARLVLGTLFS